MGVGVVGLACTRQKTQGVKRNLLGIGRSAGQFDRVENSQGARRLNLSGAGGQEGGLYRKVQTHKRLNRTPGLMGL